LRKVLEIKMANYITEFRRALYSQRKSRYNILKLWSLLIIGWMVPFGFLGYIIENKRYTLTFAIIFLILLLAVYFCGKLAFRSYQK